MASIVGIAIRHYFSLNHLAAASQLAKSCEEIESSSSDSVGWSELKFQIQANAIGALISSVAFMEATINEVFTDCYEGTSPHSQPFPNAELLGAMWARGIPRSASYSVLEKFQIALTLAGKETISKSEDPFQSANTLIFARNHLIHFEPEYVRSTTPPEKPIFQRIHSRLKGKFSLNSLAPSGSLFFPDKALGAGSSAWAVKSALSFVDLFFDFAGVRATYDHVRTETPYSYFQEVKSDS